MNARVFLVDASVHVFRAYYSLPPDMTDVDGYPVNAVYGFTGFLLTLLEHAGANSVAVCFDESLETSFRNDLYPDYKANRDPAPEDLRRQFTHCRAVAEALGLPCFSDNRYEADDLIGALHYALADEVSATIVTSDKDLAQLLRPADEIWDVGRNRRMGPSEVEEHFGVRPDQIADFLALTGDAVDNIPGVPGIGPKTAVALLQHFDTLEALTQRLDEVQFLSFRGAKTVGARIRNHIDQLTLSRQLTEIVREIPHMEVDCARRSPCHDTLDELYRYLRFGRLIRRRSGLPEQ